MLTPQQIRDLREQTAQITDPIADYLLRDIVRRIAQAGQLTSTAAYQIWVVQHMGVSQREVKKQLRKLLKLSHQEIRRIMYQSTQSGYELDVSRFPTVTAVPFSKNAVLQQILSATVELAEEDFTNITQTIGFVNPFGKAEPLTQAYRSCTDFAFKQVVTGAASYTEAIRQATRNLAGKGVRVINYESGVHTSLEAAVRRNIMGGLGLLQEQVSQVTHDQLGCDGWEITAHANSAPDHEPIQGKQYADAAYQALNNSLRRRIGTLNCGHAAFPIILGVNQPQYTPAELEKFRQDNEKGVTVDGKHYTGYEATQKQRALEQAIRRQKNQIMVDEAAGDDEKLLTDRISLNILRQRYAEFSKAAELRTQEERTEVAGFEGKVAKMPREVEKYSQIRYHKDGRIVVTDDWTEKGHVNIPKTFKPNAVVDTLSLHGKQRDRTIYDASGVMKTQIHGGDHGHPKLHPYGTHGEHIHDYTWSPDNPKPDRPAREATGEERIQHGDILGGDADDS